MKRKPSVLLCTLILGLGFHFGGLYWLHQHPLAITHVNFNNSVRQGEYRAEIEDKKRRTEIVTRLFHQATERPLVKEGLHGLKGELTPDWELSFKGESDPFTDEGTFFDPPEFMVERSEERGSLSLLVAPATSFAPLYSSIPGLGAPPLASLQFEEEGFKECGTLACSEHFDVQLDYAPKKTRPGFVFKITLLPRTDIQLKSIRQNYYFLIDRSNSIPRTRYAINKQAVAAALQYLKPGDRFNILIFDDKVVRFHPKEIEWSEEAVERACAFMEAQGHGGFFAATELYASLGNIIPQDVAEDEINTAILLSDGDTYLSKEKQRLTIGKWTALNKGKIALFTIASGPGNNLPLLELISAFNKGALVYSQEHKGVSDRLSYLMRTLQYPIGKEMVATALSEDKGMSILLQPKTPRIPNLYQNRPFVLYGSTNKLSPFVLFLQGRYYGHPFDIKKRISFENSRLDPYSVERGWTQLLAHEFYERYFEEGQMQHLEAARQILSPLNLPTPFIE